MVLHLLKPSKDAMKDSSESMPGRLSRPGTAPLTAAVAASLADRIYSDHDRSVGLADAVAGLSEVAFLELAHHALEAALEALDSHPVLTADLLPGTANAVRAQIARGCIGGQAMGSGGYVMAEIDFRVWEQLLDADLRAAPPDTLGPAEAAGRRRAVLDDLGIRDAELGRYRDDRRVVLAMSDLGTLTSLGPVVI